MDPDSSLLSRNPYRWLAAIVLALGFTGLLVVQGVNTARSEGRRVGVALEAAEEGIRISRVSPGLAAEDGGLEAGDVVLRLDGLRTTAVGDWDRAAAGFSPDRPVQVEVLRDGRERTFVLTPGGPFPVLRVALNLLAVLAHLGLVLLVLLQRRHDVRTRLLMLFSLAVALEMALPVGTIGNVHLLAAAFTAYYLLTGLEIGLELHLAALLPERPGWLRRRPWVVPAFYAVGLTLGGLTAATFLAEDIVGADVFPWSSIGMEDVLLNLGLPLWALGVAALLAVPTFTHPQAHRRQQAGLVLAGIVPWVVWVLVSAVASRSDVAFMNSFFWPQVIESLILLCYPAAVFVAIFRYQLFDIRVTLRRSLLYGILTGVLILVFYAALGAGGAIFSQLVEERGSVWAIAGATLVLGLLFAPLMRLFQRWIDRRLFPERHALRAHLVALASELPSLGKLPLMGEHLVSRIGAIFNCRSASLWIADPASEVLSLLARKMPPHGEEMDQGQLLALRDPAVAALRRMGRPATVEGFSSGLRDLEGEAPSPFVQRLEAMDADLLVPLTSHQRLVGLLVLGPRSTGDRYRGEEIELLDLLSLHVASVFENARLYESATYESLTGLLRREAILEKLDLELQRAQRYDRPLTVGLADLDHFKQVNDAHGHLTGDSLLKRIAGSIEASLRNTDAVGRYGGEEFLIVLPETDLAGALVVAEKVRLAVAESGLRLDSGEEATVTVSIGLATLEQVRREAGHLTGPRDLIAAADRALYRAKGAGRNRVHPLLSRAG